MKKWDQTHDEQASQGWAPFIIDTNGNGKVDAFVEPNQPVDPTKDKRVLQGFYGASPNPADGTVWASVLGFPGTVARFDPKTNLTEVYEIPYKDPRNPNSGFSPRGMDISTRRRCLGGARERSLRELRSQALQGQAERSRGSDLQALPGRLEAVHAPGPAVQRVCRYRTAASKRRTTTGSISTTRSASARTSRSPPAISRMRCSLSSTKSG